MDNELISRFVNARRKYIASQFGSLNSMQKEAVLTTDGPLLVLAGAGSGKTTVLINRIANLIRFGRASDSSDIPDAVSEENVEFLETLTYPYSESEMQLADMLCALDPADPWSIIAITFTNKAANELKDRLSALLGPEAQDIWAMTFHSACCRILRREIERLGYGRNFTIYDTSDTERLMKEILKDMGLDDKVFPVRHVLNIIGREKDKMVTAEELLERVEQSGDYSMLQVAKAYQRYQKRLKDNNAVDFDDIIMLTVQLLQNHKDVRAYYQRKFRYILVDEYQDTNHAQYLFTSLLAGAHSNICVVGDDDQSIYRFRGASIENILNFEQQYRGSRIIRLEQNYRSTQSILNVANAVIAHNLGRKGKYLWTANGTGDPITVYEASDEGAEGNFVAGQIITRSKGKNFKDYAVLYRTNAQSNALEYAFKRNGIPYRVIGGMRFFDRAEVKDMLSYLCVLNNRNDDLRLRRIINNPPRGIGAKAIESVERMAAAEGTPLYRVISDPYSYGPLEKAADKLMRFTALVEELAGLLNDGMSLPEFYEELMIRSGYTAMLESKPTEENKTRLENIRELKSSIVAYVQNADSPSLAGFLEEIALYTDIEQYDESDDAVVMMTIHSAKGLEFPNVFLVGLEEGLFPGMRAIGDHEEMEEERRLCYVAVTRAKERLTISYARQRMLYGRTNATLPSRFLQEMPENAIVKTGGYSTGYARQGMAYSHNYASASMQSPVRTAAKSYASFSGVTSSQTTGLSLYKGDMVMHTAFGRGMVLSVIKMGGDALLEIAFDEIGTKKLMAKTASAHMKKL